MMRASPLAVVFALPIALAGCPAFLSDWTISDSAATDVSVDDGGSAETSGVDQQTSSPEAESREAEDGHDAAANDADASPGAEEAGSSSDGSPDAGSVDTGSMDAGSMDDSGGADAGCKTGAVRCSEQQPQQRQTCISGVWLDNGAACSGACLDGACVECSPGSRSCASPFGSAETTVCDATGAWVSDSLCTGTTPVCAGLGICWACTAGAGLLCPFNANCSHGSCCKPDGSCGCSSADGQTCQ